MAKPGDPVVPDALDVFEQLRAAGDAAMPKLIERVQSVINGGAKVVRHFKCPNCGHANNIELEGTDIREARQLIEMFAEMQVKAAKSARGDGGVKATKIQTDLSEMTNAELAAYIAKLKEEIDTAQEG